MSRDDAALIATGTAPGFREWLRQMERINGCAAPVYLVGHTITRDVLTGAILHVFSSAGQPRGRLAVACGNRRASRCRSCAWLHAGDTFQLVVSGLAGGKGVPASVAGHPRAFVTLTAPSFGAVHRECPGEPCHPRRGGGLCAHGAPVGCGARHLDGDPVIGWPLCGGCYDYERAVLWNGHAGPLWDDFAKRVRVALASVAGVSRSELRAHVRLSFAKVAEYQRRGAVHLHAVVRLDGPDGPGTDEDPGLPPEWATVGMLEAAVRSAAGAALVHTTEPDVSGRLALRFGAQVDVRPITTAGEGSGLTDGAVAAYIAKYVTKGHIPGLVLDARVPSESHIEAAPLSDHGKALMRACWDLGEREEYAGLRLRDWSFQLGFRGNIATKSRLYSTTYGALRDARATFRQAAAEGLDFGDRQTVTESRWQFEDMGHTPGEALFAAGVALAAEGRREAARDARDDLTGGGAG
ncbi:replication initiator [Catenulispora rubra]|uniref:replication initiator n=1 Tax=Catenulispora rubra TaxID=280293 RepID=UPI001E32553C|nr:replication initiator [Catenulispora rubra]